jgi:glycine/D-amino acid oxidase-like deaminating enzyme
MVTESIVLDAHSKRSDASVTYAPQVGSPLSAAYRAAVLWHDTATPHPVDLAALPERADTAVVGAGYCGLAAGAELARRGQEVVVLDAEALGWGASTRNGGMVLPELKAGPHALARRYGALGQPMHAWVERAFDGVEELIGVEGIECDYERCGQLYVTHSERGARHLDALADELVATGSPAHVVRGEHLRAEIASPLVAAGLVVERGGALHPARFHAGLARVADDAGASLHPHTRATSIERAGGGWRVRTSRGTVTARDVLVATNAYADELVPALRRRVLPMGSFIIATAPLDPALAAEVLPTRRVVFNDRNLLWYWRLDPDGRMVFGGRKRLGAVALDEARDFLARAMVEVHPQLAGVPVERAWGGSVALTLDRLPHCGRIDGLWYATGCNGSGVATNTWLGHEMAGAICGGEPPPFAQLRHRAIPLHRARRAWLPAVSAWFRLQDRAR